MVLAPSPQDKFQAGSGQAPLRHPPVGVGALSSPGVTVSPQAQVQAGGPRGPRGPRLGEHPQGDAARCGCPWRGVPPASLRVLTGPRTFERQEAPHAMCAQPRQAGAAGAVVHEWGPCESASLALGVLAWPPTSFSRGWRWRNTPEAILCFFRPRVYVFLEASMSKQQAPRSQAGVSATVLAQPRLRGDGEMSSQT